MMVDDAWGKSERITIDTAFVDECIKKETETHVIPTRKNDVIVQ